jgi:hypothetical protein
MKSKSYQECEDSVKTNLTGYKYCTIASSCVAFPIVFTLVGTTSAQIHSMLITLYMCWPLHHYVCTFIAGSTAHPLHWSMFNNNNADNITRQGPHRIRHLQQFFSAAGTCLPLHCLAMIRGYTDSSTNSPLTRHEPHRTRRVQRLSTYSLPG